MTSERAADAGEPLTDSDKLRVLAVWFDLWDQTRYEDRQRLLDDERNPGKNDVQEDLRRIADNLLILAAARGEPGLDAHTYRMPDGRLHCRCVEPGLLGERVARQAFDWVMEHEVEPWASGPVLASHGATFARKFAALATPTTPEPDQ